MSLFGLIHRQPLLDAVMVFFAKYLPYLLVLAVLFLIFRERGWRRHAAYFSEAALALILARGIVTEVIRFFYHRPRPFNVLGIVPLIPESGWSFPSGHAAFFFALALTVFFWDRRSGWWYFAFAALVGAARVAVGVHWPLDIVGGAAAGLFSALIAHRLVAPYARALTGVNVIP